MLTSRRPAPRAAGVLAGAAGWYAMDQVLRFLYLREHPRVKEREANARSEVPALERAVEELAELLGAEISKHDRQAGGKALQWTIGIGAGLVYGAVRESLPGHGVRRGLLYGALFSLVVDETLTPLLGLAPGPAAFPWQTHARGFAGHLVFGAVAELTMQALKRR